ncbi:uncharacterized protein LOC106071606 [Biomphalaria glabrata]|uniref:Uncharacterized protein LOC106071606 n=1 Tax=Biomphalaria glabrata TaxID=6526 RepID=A0A9W2YXE3_BIOGL|nr:uncharacterized protein LOC106071606 [Biomphalaria glabrata]KAI8745869.1 hypothetical protein BgiMline_019585 [Biomphalaria glabrata]
MDDSPICTKRIKLADPADKAEDRATDVQSQDESDGKSVVFKQHPALEDQGKHEIEVLDKDYESAISWKTCTKNPGHFDFIPTAKFSQENLPEKFRDEDIYQFIKSWALLTVRLVTTFVSRDRTEKSPFFSSRGTYFPRTGTGKVTDVYHFDDEDTPCPCQECASSKTPAKIWKAIWIMTAMHVVFDDTEVESTTVDFFYEDEESKSDIVKLKGLRVVDFNLDGDWCKFECATHDLDFAQRIEDALSPMMDLGEKIQEKFEDDDDLNMAVIASHPHGCAKCITVGKWSDVRKFEKKNDNVRWTTYSYTTATCKGSSGAPVWILGTDRRHMYAYYSHVHSEGGDPTTGEPNKSGAGDVLKTWEI